MRSRRYLFLFLAFYLVFIGGSAYYTLVFPVRLFHHALMTGLVAFWFFRKWHGDGLPRTPLNLPIAAIIGVWFLTALTSIDPRMAFENLWFLLLHTVIFFVLIDLFQRGRQRLVMETQFILGSLVVVITGLELASWYFGLGITPGTQIGWFSVVDDGVLLPLEVPRVQLAMNISTLLAGYTAPLITLALGWSFTARRRDYRITLRLLAVLLTLVLILTFSRGGLLSLLAALGTLTLLRIVQQGRITQVISPRLIFAGVIVMIVGFVAIFTLSQTRSSGDQVRLDLYRSAAQIFADNPVTGVGVGGYGRAYRDYRTVSILTRDRLASAHNLYLNTAAEIGIIGVVVVAWAGVVLVRAWWQTWRRQDTPARKLRVETCIAALVGVGVHSMVDVFTTTPIVSLVVLLLAYSVTGHRTVLDERPPGIRWAAALGLVITLGYGVFLFQIDRAHIQYRQSLPGDEGTLLAARQAESLDPSLNLYDLQIAYLLGQAALDDPTQDNLTAAINAYEHALELEPTWDTGWINLAALFYQQGDAEQALAYLNRAREINPLSHTALYVAQLSETTDANTSDKLIIRNYRAGMFWNQVNNNRLPVAETWTATYRGQYALKDYLQTPVITLDLDYRIISAHDPAWAAWIVPEAPETAAEYWVAGEHALTVQDDPRSAAEYFTQAIQKDPRSGDYYASRARATYQSDPAAARHDLDMADLLGTRFEYPDAIRARMTDDPVLANQLRAQAVPPYRNPQEFAAVLYGGRAANFAIYPVFAPPTPGQQVLQPWYDLAQSRLAAGERAGAVRVYEAILDYAPDETEARQRLQALNAN